MTRLLRRLAVPLCFAVVAVACGDDAATDAAGDTEPAAVGSVALEHANGTTTLDARPDRIVTLGLQWTDVVLSFGVTPVGYQHDPLAGDDGRFPWHGDQLDGVTALDTTEGVPFEQVASLEPDLILVSPWLLAGEADYDTLSAIAPTVAGVSGAQVDRWQDLVEVVGVALGEPEEADAVVAEVDALVAETADRYPGLRGKTFLLVNHVPGDSLYVVADEDDGSSVFFQALGMEISPAIVEVADGVSGRAQLSFEQVGLLDADLLVMFHNDGTPEDLVGYDDLPAVADGAVADIGYEDVVGLNTPTPLSIPHSLEVVRPALEAAAT